MGTNYYHRFNECSHCGRYDERHIGKNSAGWQFSFRGYRSEDDILPLVESWQEWKKALKTGRIFDEYRNEVSFDDFVAKVEKTKGKQNHYDYLRKSPHYGPSYLTDMWKDAEGWDFTLGEFS